LSTILFVITAVHDFKVKSRSVEFITVECC